MQNSAEKRFVFEKNVLCAGAASLTQTGAPANSAGDQFLPLALVHSYMPSFLYI